MTDINEILGVAKAGSFRRVKSVDLFPVDPEVLDEHTRLDEELNEAIAEDRRHNRTPVAPQLAQELAELEAKIAESAVTFKFEALSFRAWSELLGAHPPTQKQIKAAAAQSTGWRDRQHLDHNPDTFPTALVAACAVDPEMTVEQARELADALGPDQFQLLVGAAVEVNRGGMSAPKSMAAGTILRLSEASGSTAAPGASRRSDFLAWPEGDQRAALEWQAYEDSLCGGCGQPRAESLDPEMDDRYDVDVVVCHACAARERKAEVVRDSTDGAPALHGVMFITTPDYPPEAVT